MSEFEFPHLHITRRIEEEGETYEEAVTPPVCDFCFDKRVRWQYPCERFVFDDPANPETMWGSDGEWTTCDKCAKLVDARDRAGLVARISYSWTALGHPPRYEQIVALEQMVQMFFDLAGEREAFG